MAWSSTCKRTPSPCVIAFVVLAILITIGIVIFIYNRSELCENGELYYEETGTCFRRGFQGPCNDTMVLEETYPKSVYGGCSCAYLNSQRPLLYHIQTNKCYFIFSQGFCQDGFWVHMTESGEPFCAKNICVDKLPLEKNEEVVPLKGGSCVILNKKTEGCQEVVQFIFPRIYPFCPTSLNKLKFSYGSVAPPNSPCRLGSYPNIMNICTPKQGKDIIFH